jgi:flagellar basal-body rod modification protein FlgD
MSEISQINTFQTKEDYARTQMLVDSFNKSLMLDGRERKQELGKDDFLKLLITQLQHQDPTKPLEDKEFIGQMAQFSSLEQMKQVNDTLSLLNQGFLVNQTLSLLGTEVKIQTPYGVDSGIVTNVVFEAGMPKVEVNNSLYPTSFIYEIGIPSIYQQNASSIAPEVSEINTSEDKVESEVNKNYSSSPGQTDTTLASNASTNKIDNKYQINSIGHGESNKISYTLDDINSQLEVDIIENTNSLSNNPKTVNDYYYDPFYVR